MPKTKKKELAVVEAKLEILPQEEVEICNQMHKEISDRAERARIENERTCHYAVIFGLRLQAMKEKTPHGQWGKMFKDRKSKGKDSRTVFKFSQDTATRYMNAAEGALNRPGLSRAAAKRIRALGVSEPKLLTDEQHNDLDKATRGETLTQLYIDLGLKRVDATGKKTLPNKTEKEEKKDEEKDSPEENFAESIYGELCEHLEPVTRSVSRGDLAHLNTEQLAEFQELARTYLDAAKKINTK